MLLPYLLVFSKPVAREELSGTQDLKALLATAQLGLGVVHRRQLSDGDLGPRLTFWFRVFTRGITPLPVNLYDKPKIPQKLEWYGC